VSKKEKIGICPVCHKGPRYLSYRHPDEKGKMICYACYVRLKRYRARGISRLMPIIKARKEKTNKPAGRKLKYPTRESVVEELEARELQGKENFSGILYVEDLPLYWVALNLEIELPENKNPPIKYNPGDLVENQNPKDPRVYKKIGAVVSSSDKEIIVDFKEPGRIRRVYQKWRNLNNIVLHARNPRRLAKEVKRE